LTTESQRVDRKASHPNFVLATVLIGTFVGTINNTAANVSLPEVISDFDVPLGSGTWFITAYLLTLSVLMPLGGRLIDFFGTRKLYLLSMFAFLIVSVCVPLAPNFGWVLVFRGLQGVFGSITLPTVMVTIATYFPAGKRGRAMGAWAGVNGTALALGPPIGGVITDAFGWRAVFWASIPVVVIALILSMAFLPHIESRKTGKLDLPGGALFTGGLALLLLALSQGPRWGWSSVALIASLATSTFLLGAFAFRSFSSKDPFLDLGIFKNRAYLATSMVAGLQMMVQFGTMFLTPLMLVLLFEKSVGFAGLVLFLLPLNMGIAGPWMGRLVDKNGSYGVIRAGCLSLLAGGVMLIVCVRSSELWPLYIGLVFVGWGIAAIQAPAASLAAESLPSSIRGVGLGTYNTIRFTSGLVGTAIFSLLLEGVSGTGNVHRVSKTTQTDAFTADLVLLVVLACFTSFVLRFVMPRSVAMQRPA
jgi:EmrB/QacA subfamily drug resistance transporter